MMISFTEVKCISTIKQIILNFKILFSCFFALPLQNDNFGEILCTLYSESFLSLHHNSRSLLSPTHCTLRGILDDFAFYRMSASYVTSN